MVSSFPWVVSSEEHACLHVCLALHRNAPITKNISRWDWYIVSSWLHHLRDAPAQHYGKCNGQHYPQYKSKQQVSVVGSPRQTEFSRSHTAPDKQQRITAALPPHRSGSWGYPATRARIKLFRSVHLVKLVGGANADEPHRPLVNFPKRVGAI